MYACNDNAVLNCREKKPCCQELSYNAMTEFKSHGRWQQPLQPPEIKAVCGEGRTYTTCIRQLLSLFCMDKLQWLDQVPSCQTYAFLPTACIKWQNKVLKASATQESVKLAKQMSKDIYQKIPIIYLSKIYYLKISLTQELEKSDYVIS